MDWANALVRGGPYAVVLSFVALFVFAAYKNWIVFGFVHRERMADKDKMIEFFENAFETSQDTAAAATAKLADSVTQLSTMLQEVSAYIKNGNGR